MTFADADYEIHKNSASEIDRHLLASAKHEFTPKNLKLTSEIVHGSLRAIRESLAAAAKDRALNV